jgi:cyanuric acid amidohydrolase
MASSPGGSIGVVLAAFDAAHPGDLDALDRVLAAEDPARVRRAAVFLRVAGDYDDGSRERTRAALDAAIARRGLTERMRVLVAVGCEGVATPCGYVLIERELAAAAPGDAPRLALGFGHSPVLDAAEREPERLVDHAAQAVRAAAADAGLASDAVATAFVKVPQGSGSAYANERVRGRLGRAAAALGTGVALGEIDRAALSAGDIGTNASLYCPRAQCFAGPEVTRVETIVLGNRRGAGGELVACAGIARDLIDARSIRRMLLHAGMQLDADGELVEPGRVAAVFAKGGPAPDGTVRGAPTAIFGSTITPERHMRAALSGLLGGLLGSTRAFVTGDPVHAAPAGGVTVCAIVRC